MNSLQKAKIAVSAENPSMSMPLKFEVSNQEIVKKMLEVSDLTKDESPRNLIKTIYLNIINNLKNAGFSDLSIIRHDPIVSTEDNFDNLLFTPGNPGRSSTYTRYVDEDHVLRTHTSASIPSILREYNLKYKGNIPHSTMIIPGTVYRRDVIDPKHLDVFHQIDIWELTEGRKTRSDLLKLVQTVFDAACPDAEMIVLEAIHPYTKEGIEVYAKIKESGQQVEVLEAGLIHDEVLLKAGIDPKKYGGLALGMGIERLIMAQKELPDIRLIRSNDPRISKQMENLSVFTSVSSMPAIIRDMSYCVSESEREEDVCEDIRIAFDQDSYLLEEVIIKNRINYKDLTEKVRDKLGIKEGQDNILATIKLRHPDRTLNKQEANILYERVYPLINKGLKGYSV